MRGTMQDVSHCPESFVIKPLTLPSAGNPFKRLLINAHISCFPDLSLIKYRLGPWNTVSPWNDAIRLNCGVSAFKLPVSYGDPCFGSEGYSSKSASMSADEARGSQYWET